MMGLEGFSYMSDWKVLSQCSEICDGIYISGREGLQQVQELGIKAVISLTQFHILDLSKKGIEHLVIKIDDLSDANLLQYFPYTLSFIEKQLEKGFKILVHCEAGVSRSASTVCCYLMKKYSWTYQEAIEKVRAGRQICSPNLGFIKQLKLFKAMDFKIDPNNKEYRMLKLSELVPQWQYGRQIDAKRLGQINESDINKEGLSVYRCRKCQRLLVSQTFVVLQCPHNRLKVYDDDEQNTVKDITRSTSKISIQKTNSSSRSISSEYNNDLDNSGGQIYIEPLAWMQQQIQTREAVGKIYCPQCNTKIGQYAWYGHKADNGEWITPAFWLQLQKLDEKNNQSSKNIDSMIRQPKKLV